MCLHNGTPCFISGPHIGVMSDISIYRKVSPPLEKGECIMGDKAYCSVDLEDQLVAPIKKPRKGQLTQDETDYNAEHGWYRASIEHCFGYMKRFKILSGIFRGNVSDSETLLADAVKIITHVDAAFISLFPHRHFSTEANIPFPRPVRVTEKKNNKTNRSNSKRSRSSNSSSSSRSSSSKKNNLKNVSEWDHVDTENIFSSFELNDHVMAWFDDDYYHAKITAVDKINRLFDVVFFEDQEEVTNYKAQWLKHLD